MSVTREQSVALFASDKVVLLFFFFIGGCAVLFLSVLLSLALERTQVKSTHFQVFSHHPKPPFTLN